MAPIAKSIACLESSQTDLSDIGLYYFAIGATLKQIFDSDTNPFSPDEAGQIHVIFNSWFCDALSEGPTDAPISALYLHPHKHVKKKNLNPLALTIVLPTSSAKALSSESSGPTIQNYVVFAHVLTFLKVLLEAQQLFLHQFKHYACDQYPFDTPLQDEKSTLSWWMHLTRISEGNILVTLAIKIFSVQPSSMPEECTMSVFTHMNSVLQNCQDVHTLVDMTQIRQWYMYDPASKCPECPTINFYDLDAQIFWSNLKDGKWEHDAMNSLLLTNSHDGDEEIEEDKAGTWLDDVRESSTTLNDIEFNMEPEIDLSADGFLVVLADLAPDHVEKNKGNGKAEEIEELDDGDNECSVEWS
ncbi:hypothetical protein BDR04DRAFT_1149081 [Suillus decipiens]|nr:hypothetical protein BDR04DRAFT_1149081 [Suillus decipiens]